MTLADLLDRLNTEGATLAAGPDGLRLVGPARVRHDLDVRRTIRDHRNLLVAHAIGVRTGHAIGFCTDCGAASMTHYMPAAKYPPCRMTPGCDGRHALRQADVDRLSRARAPARPKQSPAPANPPADRHLLGPRPTWPTPTTDPQPREHTP